MATITKSSQLIDYEIDKTDKANPPWEFDFVKFSSQKFSKKMIWDSDGNDDGETTIGYIFQNVKDSKVLTIMKKQHQVVEKYIKNAKLKKLKGDKKGGIDFFQISYKIDGTLKSLYLKNPEVVDTQTILDNKVAFFVFTLRTESAPNIGGVGMQAKNMKKVE